MADAARPRDWLLDTVVDVLGCDRSKVTDDARLIADLGADSLDALELVMVAEDYFHIAIADDEALDVETFGQLAALLQRKLAA